MQAGLTAGLHAAGFFSYELGYALEPRLHRLVPSVLDTPLLWIGLFDNREWLEAERLDAWLGDLAPPPPLGALSFGHDEQTHVEKVNRILELIHAGDIYQANLTFPIRFRYEHEPLSLYAALRARQPVAHGGVVATGETWVLSVSPELFFTSDGTMAETRPMKGTAPRGQDEAADRHAAAALCRDPKQRAENLMITDLIRNDLTRIAEPGTVRVPHLFALETHPTFHALTSSVTARLQPGVSPSEQLRAMFPCGSIVGAPKIRAAEVLATLEESPRGIYTGSIGAFAPNGAVHLNVAIRTAVLQADGSGSYGVGGGIVADSDAKAEYAEALLKGRVLTDLAQEYALIETMRYVPGEGIRRLDLHLARLRRSAETLGFRFDPAAVRQSLHAWTAAEQRRLRLQLSRNGRWALEDTPIPAEKRLLRVGIASVRLDAADPFLRHKTTRREVYDAATAEAQAKGWDEAILLDRSGQVADGARRSVFVRVRGMFLTPPIRCGALPGVLRAEMLQAGGAQEGVLMPADLAHATAIWMCNSLRGQTPCVFAA